MSDFELRSGDCLALLKRMPSGSVDLVLTSPPYEDARQYGIGFNLRGQAWVDWAVARFLECYRVSRGPVFWVVQGRTKKFRWSAVPALLMADLHRRGVNLRCPPMYHRVGIPGSGGPDWLRCDYEFVVAATPPGKLPWSDNTAAGHPPKWAPGGEMSHRLSSGKRVNQWGPVSNTGQRRSTGKRQRASRPSHRTTTVAEITAGGEGGYTPPVLANPGNVIRCKVGGRLMGDDAAHRNEAPFPESLCDPLIRSFCPPGGVVLDPFMGSGTTLAVAKKLGRKGIGWDVRHSMVVLTRQRLGGIQAEGLFDGNG